MKKIQRLLCVLLAVFMIAQSLLIGGISETQAAGTAKLSKKKANIYVGCCVTLKLNGAPASRVKWKSSNKKIATVTSKGKVTGIRKGKAYAIATYKGRTYKATINVLSNRVTTKNVTLYVGSTYQLNFLKRPNAAAKWSSSNKAKASVNSNGFISAKSAGVAKITATVKGEKYVCNVKVVDALGDKDFDVDGEDYKNYIDLVAGKGTSWYYYFDNAGDGKSNRGVTVGSTYNNVINAFGLTERKYLDASSDSYKQYFNTQNLPRTYVEYSYRYNYRDYVKKFYFDRNNNLVLIIWYNR